jgi:hypothetical protein
MFILNQDVSYPISRLRKFIGIVVNDVMFGDLESVSCHYYSWATVLMSLLDK